MGPVKEENTKRQPNFTSAENEALITQIEKRKTVLFGSFSQQNVSKTMKTRNWTEVTDAINKVSSTRRTAHEVKTRWKNLSSENRRILSSKMSKSSMAKTGGGPPLQNLSSSEIRFLGIIGNDSVVGIQGGTDTSKLSTKEFSVYPSELHSSQHSDDFNILNMDEESMVVPEVQRSGSRVVPAPCTLIVPNPSSVLVPVHTYPQNQSAALRIPSQQQHNFSQIPLLTPIQGDLTTTINQVQSEQGVNGVNVAKMPKLNNNTKLVKLQEKILGELESLKTTSHERLSIEKQRLEIERQKLELLKNMVGISHLAPLSTICLTEF